MGATYVSDGHNVLYSENRDADNLRIQATYLPKALPKGMGLTPDALAVDVLEQEKVNGISIGSLSDSDVVTFRRNPGDGAFVTVLASTPSATSQSLPHPDGNAVILDGNLSSSSSATSQSLPHPDGNAVMLDGNLERMFIAIIATWLGVATLMLCLGAVGLSLVSLGRHLSRSYKAMVRWGARLCGGVRETLAWLRRCGSRAQKIMERPLIPNPLALLRGSIGYVLQSARRGLRRRRNRARGTGLVAAPASTISRSSKIEILPIAKAAPSPSEIATRESR